MTETVTVHHALHHSTDPAQNIAMQTIGAVEDLLRDNTMPIFSKYLDKLNEASEQAYWRRENGISDPQIESLAEQVTDESGRNDPALFRHNITEDIKSISEIVFYPHERQRLHAIAAYYLSLCDATAAYVVREDAIENSTTPPGRQVPEHVIGILTFQMRQYFDNVRIILRRVQNDEISTADIHDVLKRVDRGWLMFRTFIDYREGPQHYKLLPSDRCANRTHTAAYIVAKIAQMLLVESWFRQVAAHVEFKRIFEAVDEGLDWETPFHAFLERDCFVPAQVAKKSYGIYRFPRGVVPTKFRFLIGNDFLPSIVSRTVLASLQEHMQTALVVGRAPVVRPSSFPVIPREILEKWIVEKHILAWRDMLWPAGAAAGS
jgi:hypothetical protein